MAQEPRIYVACLASYTNGKLHGAWIDCEGKDSEDLAEEIKTKVLDTSPEPNSEEYAVHDNKGFGGWSLGEHPSLDEIVTICEMIKKNSDAYLGASQIANDIPTLESLIEGFQGIFDSKKEYGAQFWEDSGLIDQIPQNLRSYINYESWVRDCEYGGDIVIVNVIGKGIYVYSNN